MIQIGISWIEAFDSVNLRLGNGLEHVPYSKLNRRHDIATPYAPVWLAEHEMDNKKCWNYGQ